MNRVMFLFFSLSLSGSILALVLLALKPIIKKRLSQTWQYYIWLVVILRFLLPFSPQISVVGEISRQIQNAAAPPAITEIHPGAETNEDYIAPAAPELIQPSPSPAPSPAQPAEVEAAATQPDYWRELLDNLWLLWLGVALVLFVHKAVSYRSFVRFIRIGSGTEKVADAQILELYREELAAAHVKGKLPLYRNDQASSPMLIGMFRPALVIPALETSDDELRSILRHELTHYKRLDFLYKWLTQIMLCLHWFNPLVYLINKQINKSCELSCDEAVIRNADQASRITYGNALLVSLTAQGTYSDFVASMTMSENGKIVKERLEAIMSFKKKSVLAICLASLLTIALLCGFAFSGAYRTVFNGPAVDHTEKTSVAQPQQIVDSSLHFVEKEYSPTELKELAIFGIRIDALSENIEITQGGDTLKLGYYEQEPNSDYTLQNDGSNSLVLRRTSATAFDTATRPISIQIPESGNVKNLSIKTRNGSITLENCVAGNGLIETQGGQVFINRGAFSEFLDVKTGSGKALISGTILPARGTSLESAKFHTESGTIFFQPANSAWDHRYRLDTGKEAQILVNGKQYQGGGGNINNISRSQISIEIPGNGSLVVQDFSMGTLTLDTPVPQFDSATDSTENGIGSNQATAKGTEEGKSVTDLTIDADSANIIVRLSNDNQFHFDYDSSSYKIESTGSGKTKSLAVTAIKEADFNYPSFVNIQIPNNAYEQIRYLGDSAGMNLPSLNANTTISVKSGSFAMTIPAGFDKTCDLSMDSSSGVLDFDKNATNYTFSLTSESASPVLPSDWEAYRYGQVYQHKEGNGAGKINATVDKSSFVARTENSTAPDKTAPAPKGNVVIDLDSNGQNSLIHSSSFGAEDGQVLTLEIESNIKGTVDLFLYSPNSQEQRITIGGGDQTKTIPLSTGTWAYNCTGFFESGNISIVGTVSAS